ncbi:hypothetical protein Tco_0931570 [Tanacetum coccineum]
MNPIGPIYRGLKRRGVEFSNLPIHLSQIDLFVFILHSDLTKVRIGERDLAEKEVKLLKITKGRTVSLDPPITTASGDSGDSIDKLFDEGNDVGQENSVERDDDVLEETITKDASEVAAEKTKKKRKRKVVGDASGSTFPPKRLREDYHARASHTGGKSLATIRDLVPDGSSVPSGVTEPPTVVSVPPTLDDGPTNSVSGLNLRTCPLSLRSPAKDVPVTTVVVTTTIAADVSTIPPPKLNEPADSSDSFYALQDLDSETLHHRFASPSLFALLRAMDYDHLYSEFNVGVARQVCLRAKVRMRAKLSLEKKGELEDKCAKQAVLLSERDAEIDRLKSLLSLKEAEATEAIHLRGQLTIVEAADVAKGSELKDLKEKNFALEGERDVMSEKLSRDELNSKVSSLESERDCLINQKNSLESAFELFREHMEALQDDQALSSLPDHHIRTTMAISCAVNKGIQNGLKIRVDHEQAGRDLSVIEAYDPSTEAKYIDVVNALGAVDFSLLSELEFKKDSSIDDLMDSFRLEGTLAEIPGAKDLQPSPEQLMLPIHRLKDKVVLRETSLSSSLQASTFAAPITTLSMTFASSDIVLPSSIISDQTLDAKPRNEDPPVVTFEKEELGTSLE